MADITPEFLRKILDYNPETGVFTWRVSRNANATAGSIAGSKKYNGYIYIAIDNKLHLAHRIAWFYSYGEWPPEYIDHMNRIPSDNRLENLRLATNAQNQLNAKLRNDNSSGQRGVHKNRRTGKYEAFIFIKGKKTPPWSICNF